MTARQAGAMAAAAGAKHLLLTHIPEMVDPALSVEDAAQEYGGKLGLAVPGETYMIEMDKEEDD
jgi:ribonuclease BN (tRNA processing enzyme)